MIVKTDISLLGSTYTIYYLNGQQLLNGTITSTEMVLKLDDFSTGKYIIVFGENLKQAIRVIKI